VEEKMAVRSRCLPPGWYPGTESQTRKKVEELLSSLTKGKSPEDFRKSAGNGIAGIIPHAGWDFSGMIALEVICRLQGEAETVAIIGGHLSQGDGLYAAPEEEFETPLGNLQADSELLSAVKSQVNIKEDRFDDNTVEIQLPLVKFLFPESMVLYLRAAPSEEALLLGKALYRAAGDIGRKTVVLGSTDLTHYGEAYGFMPRGTGENAVQWVKEKNDRRIIDAFLGMDASEAIKLAISEKSACSAGGAAAAMSFAAAAGVTKGILVDYNTSWDVAPAPSFVGYAGILFS
jgi:AmmeMemoRadiSam system protein B